MERYIAYLSAHPEVGLVHADDTLVDAAGRELQRREAVKPWNFDRWLRTCNLRGDTWVARRDLVMRTRLHDETLAFDVD